VSFWARSFTPAFFTFGPFFLLGDDPVVLLVRRRQLVLAEPVSFLFFLCDSRGGGVGVSVSFVDVEAFPGQLSGIGGHGPFFFQSRRMTGVLGGLKPDSFLA